MNTELRNSFNNLENQYPGLKVSFMNPILPPSQEEINKRVNDTEFIKQYLQNNNLIGKNKDKIKDFINKNTKSFKVYFYDTKNILLTANYCPNRLRIWYDKVTNNITEQPRIG